MRRWERWPGPGAGVYGVACLGRLPAALLEGCAGCGITQGMLEQIQLLMVWCAFAESRFRWQRWPLSSLPCCCWGVAGPEPCIQSNGA
jgi:hypothetical protein